MELDYTNMTPEQLSAMEREAYAAGDTDRAALIAALMEVTEERDAIEAGEAAQQEPDEFDK